MKIELTKLLCTASSVPRGSVKRWRKAPGNLENAAYAAFHYAKKLNKSFVIVTGNSNMHLVHHIAEVNESLTSLNGGFPRETPVRVVKPNGEIWMAKANK